MGRYAGGRSASARKASRSPARSATPGRIAAGAAAARHWPRSAWGTRPRARAAPRGGAGAGARASGDQRRRRRCAQRAGAELHRARGRPRRGGAAVRGRAGARRASSATGTIAAVGLLNLAMVAIGRDAADRARAMLLEVLAIAAEIGSRPAGRACSTSAPAWRRRRGDWERGARLLRRGGGADRRRPGLHRDPADEAFLAPLVARARAALGEAGFAGGRGRGARAGLRRGDGRGAQMARQRAGAGGRREDCR